MVERFETFTILLNRINRNIRKIKNKEMANYELRSPHISCLYYLYIFDELTSKELCEHCEEDKATISRSLESSLDDTTENKILILLPLYKPLPSISVTPLSISFITRLAISSLFEVMIKTDLEFPTPLTTASITLMLTARARVE